MKKNLLILTSAITLITASSFVATDCTSFEQFNKGVKFTTTSYNAEGTVISISDATVDDIVAEGVKSTAFISVISKNAKSEPTDTSKFELTCDGSSYTMDIKDMAKQQAAAMGKGYEMTITGDLLEFPTTMSAGQDLPGGHLNVQMKSKTSPISFTINTTIKDRKCVEVENKTTPAGTFSCYKITSTVISEPQMGPTKMAPTTRTSTEWFSFKVGMVRNETWKDGKLEGYRELTAFTKPM